MPGTGGSGAARTRPSQPFSSLRSLARSPPPRPDPARGGPHAPGPTASPEGGDPQPPLCLPRRGGAAAGRAAPLTSPRATAAGSDRITPPPPPSQRKARVAPMPAPPRPARPQVNPRAGPTRPPAPAACWAGSRTRQGVGAAALRPGRRSRGAGTSGGGAAPRPAPTYLTSRAPPPPRASRPHQRHVTGTGQSALGSPLPASQSERSPPPGDAPQLAASQRGKMRHGCRLPAGRGGAIGREPWRSAGGAELSRAAPPPARGASVSRQRFSSQRLVFERHA